VRRFLLAASVLAACSTGFAEDKVVYRIGIPKTAFRDVPEELVAFAGLPFQDLMKEQTGLDGEILQEKTAFDVARAIDTGKFQFGVLQGHEYAWTKEKYPELRTLFCSVERPKEIRALLLVRGDAKVDLEHPQNAKLAVAANLKDHARLFLNEQKHGSEFAATQKTATVHDAIHAVLKGEADVTVADTASWDYFQKLYPGPSKNIKVLAESAEFPARVLVYKKGAVSDEVLARVREGFTGAHKNSKAGKLMTAIRIERFDAIPEGYEKSAQDCLKRYPKPLEE
jgi:ABC-type phosphate/phosphonate transport system substrate-binding protein